MDTVTIKKFSSKKYYNADELLIQQPILFKGCRNSRAILEKKGLDEDKYIYVKMIDGKCKKCDGSSKKWDKLYLLKDWVDEELEETEIIEDAPGVIDLDDNEKFMDDDGNVLEIETRGEREVDKCYFKLDDVGTGFQMKSLHRTVTDDRNDYEKGKHYIYFNSNKSVSNRVATNKKTIYLTYMGVLRVLFVSKSGNTKLFVTWATETLFTAQMGTSASKKKLASSVLGVTVADLKAVFSKTNYVLPVIYLFTLGTVKDLRKTFHINENYKDDLIVAKIGMTKDIERRAGEHQKEYGKLKNVNIELAHYDYVDCQYISSAETDLKDILNGLNLMLDHEKYDELIIFNKGQLPMIKKQYNQISKSYIGHIAELVTRIKTLEDERKLMKVEHANELMKHTNELMKTEHANELMRAQYALICKDHENEMVKKDMELLKKDMEIMKLLKRTK